MSSDIYICPIHNSEHGGIESCTVCDELDDIAYYVWLYATVCREEDFIMRNVMGCMQGRVNPVVVRDAIREYLEKK